MGDRSPVAAGGLGERSVALQRLAGGLGKPFDLLVVGGGITGAGIALDGVSRGLSVGLVERLDFASGTSSKSSKLVHGGLRYLEQREFGLVREASTERAILGRLAPHLVEPIPFVIPMRERWMRARFGAGLWAYDALASFRAEKLHRYEDAATVRELMPALPVGKVKGGYVYYDSKTDDVRLVMEVLIQAVARGAVAANYAAVRDLSGGERMCSAQVEDTISGDLFELCAKRVIVAAGVWGDNLESLADHDARPRLRPSKGIHLVFSRSQIPMGKAAGFIPDAERKRWLFVIPWLGSVVVGTTDTPFSGDLDHPYVDDDDRAYCIDAVNSAFELNLSAHDLVGAWAGLRPLIAGRAGATADLSRNHAVYDIAPGIVGITGGKLTTYRRMAQDAVDRVAGDLGDPKGSRSRWIRLGSSDVGTLRQVVAGRAARLGISDAGAAHLVRSYGDRSLAVVDLAAKEGLIDQMTPRQPQIVAEVAYCCRSEMAVNLSDLLARRTRLSLTDCDAGIGSSSCAADVMGRELSWSDDQRVLQVNAQRIDVQRERGSALRFAHGPRLGRAGVAT